MSGLVKRAPGPVATVLAAMVTAVLFGLVSAPAAHADAPAQRSGRPATYAETVARHVLVWLREVRTEEATASGTRAQPLVYLPRVRKLPAVLSAAVMQRTLVPAPGTRNDADGLVGFNAGSLATAACLDLRSGVVFPRPCGSERPRPRTLEGVYRNMMRSLIWFDRHETIGGYQPRDTSTVEQLVDAEYPGRVEADYTDANHDQVVDNGIVDLTFTQTQECGKVTLPEHDPTGRDYGASMVPCGQGRANR